MKPSARPAAAILLAVFLSGGESGATPCPSELPVLFVVQDKSGSMSERPDPSCSNCPSKWSSAKSAVPNLVTQFSNRFRFGLAMYPGTSTTFNCAPGSTVNAVPASAAQVAATYAAAAPGGGTPTAVSLTGARTYLTGLGLNTPAYVLLITDGLPNCNTSLNAYTCQTTTLGCKNLNTCSGSSCCGLGAKDCLDDTASKAAATALLAAGIKVYVVGFGAGAGGNNKVVLDGIAQAGGTGSAYAVSDQAGLSAALNAIGVNASTCCNNACTAGAKQCSSSGQLLTCQMDSSIGCTNWVASSCGAQSSCTGGSCISCSNQCNLGAARCVGDSAQQCQLSAGGCTAWVETDYCGWGQTCSGGSCNSCGSCTLGAKACLGANTVQSCELDLWTGCTGWETNSCAQGSTCSQGSCGSCASTCNAGAKRCSGATPQTCVADAQGCTSWSSGNTCSSFCSGGSCGTCPAACAPGASRCNGNGIESCQSDSNGCKVWVETGQCGGGVSFCAGGACQACASSCQPGAKRCAGNGIEECKASANGCLSFVSVGSCASGETCANGVCIPPCSNECTPGVAKCDAQGRLVECTTAPTGCGVWKAATACPTGQQCAADACRESCLVTEIDNCTPGTVCTGTPEGQVCLPGTKPDEPAPQPPAEPATGLGPSTSPSRAHDEPLPSRELVASGAGCGCQGSGVGALGPLALTLLAFARRRRR